ncbi:MAG: ABC transporter substrate-binding protein [Turicibacter sp.]|nr:ABC transporter substrate-binding protein [Turicibacter sp.]
MMKLTFKKLSLAAVSALALLLLVACGGDENGNGYESGDENGNGDAVADGLDHLLVGMAVEPRTLDLHGTNDMASAQVSRHIFETLVLQDEDMNIVPGLAHTWTQYNDRVWEFELNDNVYFHDGTRLTAYDVYATFQRAAGSPQIEAILGMIDPATIEVVDELTIRVGTPEPFSPFLSHLAHSAAGIKSADVLAEIADDASGDLDANIDRLPIGTGPFMFENANTWVSGDRIALVRFEDYHATIEGRDLPAFSELTFRFMGDAGARFAALETGEIHIDLNPITDNFPRVADTANLRLEYVDGLRTEYLGMNNEHEHLSNVIVRQAINYAINVEEIVEAIYQGHGAVGQTQLAANVFGHNPNIVGFPHDVDRALELMAQAGLEDGFSIVLHANTERQDRVNIAQIVEQQLAAINIDVEIIQLEWATLLNLLDDGESDMFLLGWTTVTGDGDYGLFPLLHSSQHGPPGNYTRFTNADVDRLLDAARVSVDVDERLELYFEVQEILRDEAPWVVMLQERPSAVINYSIVSNLILNPIGTHYLGDIQLGE